MPEAQFLSLEDVAERLKVSDQTVRRWAKSGRLKAYKPGLEWRIAPEDLEAFLETRSYPKGRAPSSPPDEEERRFAEDLKQWIALIERRAESHQRQANREDSPFLKDPQVALAWESEVSEEVLTLVEVVEDAVRSLTAGSTARGAVAEELQRLEEAYSRLHKASREITTRASEAVTRPGREALAKAAEDREKEFVAFQEWLSAQTAER
jgi:excisionase family DNA binding protein